jgi:hypothetical protein
MANRHNPWPYPETREQILQAVMVTLAALLIGLIGTAAQAEHYRDKPLVSDNVQQAAASLSGYASEAAVVTNQAAESHSPQHYQRAYLEHLSDQVRQVTDFIHTHAAPSNLVQPTNKLTAYSAKLQVNLAQATNAADPNQLHTLSANFESLQKQFQDMEDAL